VISERRRERAFLALLPFLAMSTAAHAGANRVFVSARSGNDLNSCNNVLTPCQTFAGAVVQLNPGGEAIVLDSGGYGAVTITQSLTIEAPPGVLAFIHPISGDAVTVNAAGATVILRGLTINGGATTTNGIVVTAVSVLQVENCVFSGIGAAFPSGNGIYFATSGQLFVKDSIMRGNAHAGIWVIPGASAAQASVDRCRFEGSAVGVRDDTNAQVSIKDSVASGNSYAGFFAAFGGELNVEDCLIANNAVGLYSSSSGVPSTLRASNCTVTDNGTGLIGAGGNLLSRSNNTVQGNTTKGSFTGTYTAD